MKIGRNFHGFGIVFGVLAFAAYSGTAQTIFQSGTSGTTYTDMTGDGQGSSNPLRDLSFVTIANDANNLYFTMGINPSGNLATGGSFNYIIGITTGNPSAVGDTSASADHGNPYSRAISFDSSFGGMTDFIGIFGAPNNGGSTGTPYTSYGFNDYVYGMPSGITPDAWTKIETVTSGEPLSDQPSTSSPNEITITVPLSDFAANLSLIPGATFDFDVDSTGTSAGQTAYDSLATQGGIQSGTYSSTFQFNETTLDQYTVAVPEPATSALAGLFGLSLLAIRRLRK
ncbi:MAG TPA: hypothetical protein VH280_17740 [Verrucomicrobiae bacterium]|jgi:hypothetical protein|nr:hypothetical protein [Verrucomicrobiae bacterium]